MRRSIIWLAVLLLLLPAGALAAEVPALPHAFYGSLTVFNADGTQSVEAPAGTAVSAKIAGSDVTEDTLITAETGRYGGPGATDPKLLVGKRGGVEAGAAILFYVNSVKAFEESTFVSGAVTGLDLTVADETGPSFTELSPTGSITDRTPAIGATVSDDLAGIDPENMLVSFTVDGAAVADPQISSTGRVEYTPAASLSLGTHTVQMTARDRLGNEGSTSWSFTIISEAAPGGGVGDRTPPRVESTDPADGETGVPVDKTVTVTFSENVRQGPNYDDIAVEDADGNAVALTKSISGKVLTIDPTGDLDYATAYTVNIPAGAVEDTAGNDLAADYAFGFTTEILPAPEPEVAFTDMAGHWVEDCVAELVYRGILSGYPDGTFRPDQPITRLEAACILARALELAPGDGGRPWEV